jgi:hypothetical protein
MLIARPITFDGTVSALRSILTHAEYTEAALASRLRKMEDNVATDRLRWTTENSFAAQVEREYADAMCAEFADLTQEFALGIYSGGYHTDNLAQKFVRRWAVYLTRQVSEGVDKRADYVDQLLQQKRVEFAHMALEMLGIIDRYRGLSDDDWRAVFDARMQREKDRLKQPGFVAVFKENGRFIAQVQNVGRTHVIHEWLLDATNKKAAQEESLRVVANSEYRTLKCDWADAIK